MVADFHRDLSLSNNAEVLRQMDDYYMKLYPSCTIKRYEKDYTAQFDYKVDLIVTEKNGTKHFIDEKIRRGNYARCAFYPIETISNTTKNTKGWIYNSGAQEIVFIQLDDKKKVLYVFMFGAGLPLRLLAEKHKKLYPDRVKAVRNVGYNTEIVLIHYTNLKKLNGNQTFLDDSYMSTFNE